MASTTTERPARAALPRARPRSEPYRADAAAHAARRAPRQRSSLVIFAALFLRLWALQVLAGTKYVDQAQRNPYRTVRVHAPRGPILDRNGRALVTNSPATAVQLWPADLPKVYTALRELQRLAGADTRAAVRDRARDQGARRATRSRRSSCATRRAADGRLPLGALGRVPGRDDRADAYIRHYPYHSLAAQLLGYVGEISARS